MFRFRSSTSSASNSPSSSFPSASGAKSSQFDLPASNSASSALSTAESVPSSASNSSILSLLQAHSSASTSSSLSSALSPATSLASLPSSEPCLTVEPLHPSCTKEPTKSTASPARPSTSVPKQRIHAAAVSPRKSTLLTTPLTSRPATSTTTINAQPSPTLARRRSTIVHNTSEQRSSNAAAMAKKAKVGSAAKSSPFTKSVSASTGPAKEPSTSSDKASHESASASSTNAESSLASVAEEESTPSATSMTSPSKSAEVASSSTTTTSESKQNVVVCVRMRPSRAEPTNSDPAVWNCDSTKNQIVPTEHHPAIAKRTTSSERAGAGASIAAAPSVHDLDHEDASTSTYHFQFDKLITGEQTTDDMYHSHIAPVVRAAMEGYNGTVFAYGQTGSGKTHTMSGSDKEPGVIPRAVQHVFEMIKDEPDREFLLRVSYLEIYNETLKDLLAPLPPLSGASLQTTDRPASPIKGGSSHAAGQSQSSTLRIIEDQKQSRVIITGLREEIVTDSDTVLDLIQRGQDERHVGATDWNERSSRSHCVFQLTIESRARDASSSGKEVRISQLNLIDLAGSERAASQAERRKEGAFINKSLLTLGTVIGKLTEPSDHGDAHIPYRDSKLTRILQTSLSGNARIAVICTLSPDVEHANETLSTLKFGKRCKLVVTTAKKGTAMDDKALLQKYRKELDALRARLEANGAPSNPDNAVVATVSPEASLESQQKLDELNQQKEAAQREVEDMQKKRTDLKGQIEHLTRLILTSQSVAADVSSEGNAVAGPSTPIRGRGAHASALARRGPRMSDFFSGGSGSGYNSPVPGPSITADSTLSGIKPFELEAELAALRRQLRQQIESRQALITAHQAELAARDSRQTELQEAIRLNEEELDEAEVAYDKLKEERDEARKIALKEQEKARENRKKLLEEQEANRLLKLVAKARAGDEDKALQGQIEALREQLKVKEKEAEAMREKFEGELEAVKRSVAEEKEARSKAEREAIEAATAKQAMQAELDAAIATSNELQEKLVTVSSSTRTSEEDEVNAEFQSLVRGKAHNEDSTTILKQREAELAEKTSALDRLHVELEQVRAELASKPVTSHQELQTLRDELSASSEERQSLQVELAKVRAAASGREKDTERIGLLDAELKRANAKVAELEKEVLMEKKRTEEALNTVARPLPVPSSQEAGGKSWGGGSVPSSPIKLAAGGGSSKLRTAANDLSGLNRAGSVKEYRRYQPTLGSPSPSSSSSPAGTRSALLPHEPVFAGSPVSNKAEKEEIDRLNAVINSQRAIMADLEKSVASWKTRMKTQAELIQRLVQAGNGLNGSTGNGVISPPTSDGENEETFNAGSPRRKLYDTVPGEGFHTLPRTTHLSLSNQASNEPYYGAHTFNRPPTIGLGVQPGSPTKSNFFSPNGTWSTSSPSPLPLPNGAAGSPGKRKPRKTIEMDLKLLKSSPRVESGKNKFSIDNYPITSSQDTPTKRRSTNASAYYI
ncbi:probable kinesin motor protein 1 [Ustilago trichophora]|uniref:Probable kinesin motor protein 1 n=1 Tax=Ustilago trichophora TaxID=86804 RepID=A0A5C3DX70_9BASI|nr:probable kinesin motor protein 1 [Ustilago trichophora]